MSIKIQNLTHIYDKNGPYEKIALKDVTLSIEKGEFLGIIGHTGSGKSTLIQHLNGLAKPTSGTVIFDGTDIFSKDCDIQEIRSKIGLVFQYPEYQLFEETVYKDIAFGLKNYNVPSEKHEVMIKEAIKKVGLSEDILDKSPFELSGGQKRRVAIAGVIVMNPEVLILDEPAAGLDPYGKKQILEEIKALHENDKITVILVSHSMEDIALYANRIAVMENGEICMCASPKEVFKRQSELEKIGLDIPEVSKILNEIRKRGYEVPDNVFDSYTAAKIIYKILQGEH